MVYPDEVLLLTDDEQMEASLLENVIDDMLKQARKIAGPTFKGLRLAVHHRPCPEHQGNQCSFSPKVAHLVMSRYRAAGYIASVEWGPNGPFIFIIL